MPRVHDLTLSVADILGRPGELREFELTAVVPGVQTALARLDDVPIEAPLRAESVTDGILFTGTVTASARLTCARCLETFGEEVGLELCELYVPEGRELAEDEDAYRFVDTDIDLEPMLRDAIALALPLNPLHADDCKGLCAHCGADLNAGSCDCVDDAPDPRWAALSSLRDKLESQPVTGAAHPQEN